MEPDSRGEPARAGLDHECSMILTTTKEAVTLLGSGFFLLFALCIYGGVLGTALSEQFFGLLSEFVWVYILYLPWELRHVLRRLYLASHDAADYPSEPSCGFPMRSDSSAYAVIGLLDFPHLHLV